MTLLKKLQAWCRAALSRVRAGNSAQAGTTDEDLAQRVRLSGEW
jgi:hypothetical protein